MYLRILCTIIMSDLLCTISVTVTYQSSLASAVSPAMEIPMWLSTWRIFFWWAASSDWALCKRNMTHQLCIFSYCALTPITCCRFSWLLHFNILPIIRNRLFSPFSINKTSRQDDTNEILLICRETLRNILLTHKIFRKEV